MSPAMTKSLTLNGAPHRSNAATIADLVRAGGFTPYGFLVFYTVIILLMGMILDSTSILLIMVPIASAILVAGGVKEGETDGFAGALLMGIAFAASIGGLGTIVGSPTNAIAVGLLVLAAYPAMAWSAEAIERYEGQAYGRDDGRLRYRETHWSSGNGRRIVVYRCPGGEPFARKVVQPAGASAAPDFEFFDARDGYREGVRSRQANATARPRHQGAATLQPERRRARYGHGLGGIRSPRS